MTEFSCPIATSCSGCPWSDTPFEDQGPRKISDLKTQLQALGLELDNAPQIISIDQGRLRDKADLVIMRQNDKSSIGLYHVGKKTVVDMPSCFQMSEPLAHWFEEFRQDLPSIRKGSVRLRVAPDGKKGVWLDFANLDVKELMDEGDWLRGLMKKAVVEIGQRKKRLEEVDGRLRLKDPQFYPWFQTPDADGEMIPLPTTIANFTQPGYRANSQLVREVLKAVDSCSGTRWLELFCGVGNFTLPLATTGLQVTAFEVDRLALSGLEQALGGLKQKVSLQVTAGNAYRIVSLPPLHDFDGLVVDPPRSGLKNVLSHIQNHLQPARPKSLVYVSCHTPSLTQDLARLVQLGYQIHEITGVDQFPQTPHCEWVVSLQQENLT